MKPQVDQCFGTSPQVTGSGRKFSRLQAASPLHPHLSRGNTLDRVTDEPTPEDLDQLARSVAMSGVLGDRDRLDVVVALRRLAEIDKTKRRHPSRGR